MRLVHLIESYLANTYLWEGLSKLIIFYTIPNRLNFISLRGNFRITDMENITQEKSPRKRQFSVKQVFDGNFEIHYFFASTNLSEVIMINVHEVVKRHCYLGSRLCIIQYVSCILEIIPFIFTNGYSKNCNWKTIIVNM